MKRKKTKRVSTKRVGGAWWKTTSPKGSMRLGEIMRKRMGIKKSWIRKGMTNPTSRRVPAFLNLYVVQIPGARGTRTEIHAKTAASAKGKFWHRHRGMPFSHARATVKLIKKGR